MKLPPRLVKTSKPALADGYFLPDPTAAELAAFCKRVETKEFPLCRRLAGGVLIQLPEPSSRLLPGSIALRRLQGDLYLPVDAELNPPLLPHEAVDQTTQQGLVLLPGCCLAFDPRRRISEADLVHLETTRPEGWNPFPARPEQPERLVTLRHEPTPEELYDLLTGGAPEGTDPLFGSDAQVPDGARPQSGSIGNRAMGSAMLGAASLLNQLGRWFGMGKWTKAGADLARRALERSPRLGENVLGGQEAALREVLRELREGNVEKALRRAPIAVADPNESGGKFSGTTQLNDHSIDYSLRSLLSSGAYGGSSWLGGGNVWNQLAIEYRRLAEEATRKGDFRRAAYLYGVLLRDPRSAAKVLDAGGLHRDAALLYRDRVGDRLEAANCFERGGCFDEAIDLHIAEERFEKAGDLLRRIGEEQEALVLYRRAAGILRISARFLDAGDLLRTKGGLHDEANLDYREAWKRGSVMAVVAGERLFDYHERREAWSEIHSLVAEAEERFSARTTTTEAGKFFGWVASRAAKPSIPENVREEILDRSRLALARHLRQHVDATRQLGSMVTTLFGAHAAWSAGVVHDAREAARLAIKRSPARTVAGKQQTVVPISTWPITAALTVRARGDLLLANTAGEVLLYRGRDLPLSRLAEGRTGCPVAFAVDDFGTCCVLLSRCEGRLSLESFDISTGYRAQSLGRAEFTTDDGELPYLQPVLETAPGGHVLIARLFGTYSEYVFQGPDLIRTATEPNPNGVPRLRIPRDQGKWEWMDDRMTSTQKSVTSASTVSWRPQIPARSSFVVPSLDWLQRSAPEFLEITGIAGDGSVVLSEFGDGARSVASAMDPSGYRVSAFLSTGVIAAVSGDGLLHRLRSDGRGKLVEAAPAVEIARPAPVVYLSHRFVSSELVLLTLDGRAIVCHAP